MIAVPVSIQNEAQLPLAESLERGPDLVSERRELIVHDQYAVSADGDADVSAGAFEHVHVAGNFCRFDLDLRKVLLTVNGTGEEQQKDRQQYFLHAIFSLATKGTKVMPRDSS